MLIDRDNLGQTPQVVLTLVQGLHKGYDLYVDRYYTSPVLVTQLSKVGITITGMMQNSRKGVPTAVKSGRKEPAQLVLSMCFSPMMAAAIF